MTSILNGKAAFARKKKQGGPKGVRKESHTYSFWYGLCKTYVEKYDGTISQAEFLRSSNSGPTVAGTQSERNTFSRNVKRYKAGDLEPLDTVRIKARKYTTVEEKVVQYVDLRSKLYQHDKCGLSWFYLKEKAEQFVDALPATERLAYNDFTVSNGWLERVLKRHGLKSTTLHGEAGGVDEEKRIAAMTKWKAEFHSILNDYERDCVYNADQTGLLFQQLPKWLYVRGNNAKFVRGARQMAAKERVTLMVCTSATGSKHIPLMMVGKSETPRCFCQCVNRKPPMPYTNQSIAWFDKKITMWWIKNVFWPYHCDHFRGRETPKALLILDNCSAQTNLDETELPDKLHIINLPPGLTCRHQPADMGIIAGIKVGYKAAMLTQLLHHFDKSEAERQSLQGEKGLVAGQKATVLDAMKILLHIWNNNNKYVSEESIQRCWRKANILPASWEADINNAVGRASVPEKAKRISDDECNQLCDLVTKLTLKAHTTGVKTNTTASALHDSVMEESNLIATDDLHEAVAAWMDVDNKENINNMAIDEAIEHDMWHSSNETAMEIDSKDSNDNDSLPTGNEEEARAYLTWMLDNSASFDWDGEEMRMLKELKENLHDKEFHHMMSQAGQI